MALRGTGRVGHGGEARLRRILQGQLQTKFSLGDSMEEDGGRLETKVDPHGGLIRGPQGVSVRREVLGEKNRPQLPPIARLGLTAGGSYSQTDMQAVIDKMDELLRALAKTGNMGSI